MFTATDLEPHLADRGINLSSVQVWRVVTQTPERLSLPLLAALCDIFGCTPADLIATSGFGLWHQVPRLRARASTRALTPASRRFAAEQFTGAERFLGWLEHRGRQLGTCTQADLDAWHAGHRNDQARACRSFLISRIVRLTVDDIVRDGDEVSLRIGDPPSPVPQPFAELLVRLAGDRQNMNSAANPASRWLFPGRRAGQPLNPATLGPLICELGIPTQATRVAALRQLVLQAPAPVIAQALGFHHVTTHRHAAEAGGIWKSYAPGDLAR